MHTYYVQGDRKYKEEGNRKGELVFPVLHVSGTDYPVHPARLCIPMPI